jgi:hypothetical protein
MAAPIDQPSGETKQPMWHLGRNRLEYNVIALFQRVARSPHQFDTTICGRFCHLPSETLDSHSWSRYVPPRVRLPLLFFVVEFRIFCVVVIVIVIVLLLLGNNI